MAELNVDLLRRRIDQLEAGGTQTPASPPPLAPAGKPPDMGAMSERLAKLEGAFDWIKVTVALIGAIMIFGFGFLAMQVTRIEGRVSSLSDKVDALPDRINANLRDLTGTLAQAILAAKAAPPQVVILPGPQPAAPAPP